MSKNYAKEARLSRLRTKKITNKAFWLCILSELAASFILVLGGAFALAYFDVMKLNESQFVLVLAAGAVLFVLYLIKAIPAYVSKKTPEFNAKNNEYKVEIQAIKRERKEAKRFLKQAKKEKNQWDVSRYKNFIRDCNTDIKAIKRKQARFAKEIKKDYSYKAYRDGWRNQRWIKAAHKKQGWFVFISTVVVGLYLFANMSLSAELGASKELSEMIAEHYEFTFINYALYIIPVFHFINAFIYSGIPKARSFVDDIEEPLSTTPLDLFSVLEKEKNGTEIEKSERHCCCCSCDKQTWNEEPRELPVTLFFFRNLIHCVLIFLLSLLFIYVMPAIAEISKIEGTGFEMIFTVFQWLMFGLLVLLIGYVLSLKEYSYDCLHEKVAAARNWFTAGVIVFFICVVGFVVLILISGISNYFKEIIYSRIITTFIVMALLSLATFLLDVLMRPKIRLKTIYDKDAMILFHERPKTFVR